MTRRLLDPEKRSVQFLYLTVSGLVSGICMAFPSIFGAVIEWLAFIPAALVLYTAINRRCSLARAYWGSFWLVYSQHIIVYHWFVSFYPLEFTGMSKLSAAGVVLIAVFGLSFLAAMFGGVFGLMAFAIGRLNISRRHPILIPIAAACLYVLCEWIRTQFWIGVPWGRLALGQLTDGAPLTVLSASVFGSYFITFLIVLVSFLIAQSLALGRFKLRPVIAGILVLANLITGIVIANIPLEPECTVKVAALQGNINSRDKWETMSSSEMFAIYRDLTVEAAQEGAELILWPETALPTNAYIPQIAQICRDYGVNVLFGAFYTDPNGDPQNVLRMIDREGIISDNIYAKRHLVPFGEYVPMRDIILTVLPMLGEIAMLSKDLIPGESSALFEIDVNGKSVKLGGLICFDSIYEELAYSSASDGADIICVGTNDSWFEDSRAVYMHCAQSRLRAIETGLPVVRAANTGISAIITQKGEVLCDTEPLVEDRIISEITVDSDRSNSYIMNEVFLWACIAFIGAIPILQMTECIIKKKKHR